MNLKKLATAVYTINKVESLKERLFTREVNEIEALHDLRDNAMSALIESGGADEMSKIQDDEMSINEAVLFIHIYLFFLEIPCICCGVRQ